MTKKQECIIILININRKNLKGEGVINSSSIMGITMMMVVMSFVMINNVMMWWRWRRRRGPCAEERKVAAMSTLHCHCVQQPLTWYPHLFANNNSQSHNIKINVKTPFLDISITTYLIIYVACFLWWKMMCLCGMTVEWLGSTEAKDRYKKDDDNDGFDFLFIHEVLHNTHTEKWWSDGWMCS